MPYRDPDNYVRYSGRLAEKLAATDPDGAVWANQFDNVANRQAHIDEHRAGDLGADRRPHRRLHLRRRLRRHAGRASPRACGRASPAVRIGLADPDGAALWHYYAHGSLKAEGDSITEGIGQGRITANLEGLERRHALPHPRRARRWRRSSTCCAHEGLCLGASSGINVAGADPHGARPRARAHDRDHPLRLRHAATSRSSSTPSSCARRACRCPTGSSGAPDDLPDAWAG